MTPGQPHRRVRPHSPAGGNRAAKLITTFLAANVLELEATGIWQGRHSPATGAGRKTRPAHRSGTQKRQVVLNCGADEANRTRSIRRSCRTVSECSWLVAAAVHWAQ